MILRKASRSDLDKVLEINNSEAKWVGGEATKKEIEDYLGKGQFLVSEEDKKINGFMITLNQTANYSSPYFQWFKERIPEFIYIDRIVVDPNFQHRGIGSMMYKRLIQKETKLPIVCEVKIAPECNDPSVKFHENFGFKEMGVYSTNGEKYCRMYKREQS